MKSIDVHDLPEEEAQVVAAFVEFLRQRQRRPAEPHPTATPGDERPTESPFARWPLGVKGTLSREEIYEHL